jgi:hypothetical protein
VDSPEENTGDDLNNSPRIPSGSMLYGRQPILRAGSVSFYTTVPPTYGFHVPLGPEYRKFLSAFSTLTGDPTEGVTVNSLRAYLPEASHSRSISRRQSIPLLYEFSCLSLLLFRPRMMDPALLQTSTAAHGEGQKASFDSLAPTSPDNQHQSEEESQDEDASHPLSSDVSKRPRLRLAHACDRCKKRKIRCDTHQPCAPCQAAKNECTFKAPSRRVSTKPKGSFSGEEARPNSFSGFKRPHSPSRPSLEPVEGQSQLEARLAALEAMLGDVPPQVHNAFLASLDARLGSGTGVGIKEGQNEGVGVAFEALSGGSGFGGLGNLENDSSSSWTRPSNGLDGFATSQSEDMLGPDWSKLAGVGWQDGTGLGKRKEEEGVSEMAKRMEGMSFFYEDEIGQAKWQGE